MSESSMEDAVRDLQQRVSELEEEIERINEGFSGFLLSDLDQSVFTLAVIRMLEQENVIKPGQLRLALGLARKELQTRNLASRNPEGPFLAFLLEPDDGDAKPN